MCFLEYTREIPVVKVDLVSLCFNLWAEVMGCGRRTHLLSFSLKISVLKAPAQIVCVGWCLRTFQLKSQDIVQSAGDFQQVEIIQILERPLSSFSASLSVQEEDKSENGRHENIQKKI